MKPIKDILGDTKPKNVKKVTKAFENGGCSQYMAHFLAEAAQPTAMDFPKVKCLVTDNYFCCYSLFASFHIYWIPIFPLGGWKFKACPNCGVSQKLSSAEFKALKKA